MPSGSHGGGGGGSHGGFSGGGGSHGGFSSGSNGSFGFRNGGVFRPRGPRTVIFFGGPRIITTGRQVLSSILVGFMIFMAFFAFIMGVNYSACNETVKMIEEEHRYYVKMVQDAQADTDLQTEGIVTSVFYKTEYNKYYFEYKFYDDSRHSYDGYTFSVYTIDNVPKKGDRIALAIDDETIDENTDSIPMDYINFTLEDDGQYLVNKKGSKEALTGLIICGAIAVGSLVGVFIVYATAKRKKEEEIESEKCSEQEKQAVENKKKYCQYCGTKINPDDRNCPQCGARTL